MPFADPVFRNLPAIRELIIPPDASAMRFGMDHFDELDAQAEVENWPTGWRMDHDDREANRRRTLKNHRDRDLWVFAYGSLIWDPGVFVDEYRLGTISGWQRRFCMRIESGRGTVQKPGLMAALDEGGTCDGVVFRIPALRVECETKFMWNREMFSGSYCPVFVSATTPQGPVEALAFVMDNGNRRYVPDLSTGDAAEIIAAAEGTLGTNFEYLDSLLRNLGRLGIEDEEMPYSRCCMSKPASARQSCQMISSDVE